MSSRRLDRLRNTIFVSFVMGWWLSCCTWFLVISLDGFFLDWPGRSTIELGQVLVSGSTGLVLGGVSCSHPICILTPAGTKKPRPIPTSWMLLYTCFPLLIFLIRPEYRLILVQIGWVLYHELQVVWLSCLVVCCAFGRHRMDERLRADEETMADPGKGIRKH